jgi:hypothetical protein
MVSRLSMAYVACQLVEERDAAIAQAMDTVRDLIAEIAAGQHGARLLGKLGLVEATLDFALAVSQALAYFLLHSKSLSCSGSMEA